MSRQSLNISEVFYSIQGEGSTMGVPAIFIRLGGCNLLCGGKGTEHDKQLHNEAAWRCDTIEVWRKSKSFTHEQLLDDLEVRFNFSKLVKQGAHIIFTGGEPLIQQQAIVEFMRYYMAHESCTFVPTIEVETNGTIVPIESLVEIVYCFNVSPKLRNSGELADKRVKPAALQYFSSLHTTRWKFVVHTRQDVEEIKALIDTHKQRRKITLMPAASNQEELQSKVRMVAELCMENCFCFSSRLQIHIWNETVGV